MAKKKANGRPKCIVVNGAPWGIKFVNETAMRGFCDDDDVVGCTYAQALTIYIGDWTPLYVQRRTLLHEVMHAAWADMALIAMGKDGQVEIEHVEETVISGIDQGVFSALVDNPEFVLWLIGAGLDEAA